MAPQAPDSSAGRSRRLSGLPWAGGRRLLPWLILLLTLAGGLFLLARFYQIPSVENPSPLSIALIAVLTVLVMLGAIAAPYFILAGTDWNRSLRQLYLVVTSSLAANYSTPVKAGVPLRVYLYKRFMGIGPTTGSALVALELLLGVLVPALISVFVLLLVMPEAGLTVPMLVAAGAGAALAAIAFVRSASYDRAIVRLPLPGIARRVLAPDGDIVTAFRSVPLSSLWAAGGIYAAMFVLVGVRFFFVFRLFGGSMSVTELVGITAVAFVAGAVSLLPMGIGVRDATLVALFVQAGADRDIAIAVAALDRLLSTGIPLLLGVLSAQVLGLRAILRTEDSELQEGEIRDRHGREPSAPRPIVVHVNRNVVHKET
jgi:uncharacterized membrane protein YbhN (UPF0104 family)